MKVNIIQNNKRWCFSLSSFFPFFHLFIFLSVRARTTIYQCSTSNRNWQGQIFSPRQWTHWSRNWRTGNRGNWLIPVGVPSSTETDLSAYSRKRLKIGKPPQNTREDVYWNKNWRGKKWSPGKTNYWTWLSKDVLWKKLWQKMKQSWMGKLLYQAILTWNQIWYRLHTRHSSNTSTIETMGIRIDCTLCKKEKGTLGHILGHCDVALGKTESSFNRIAWRHDKVWQTTRENIRNYQNERISTDGRPRQESARLPIDTLK